MNTPNDERPTRGRELRPASTVIVVSRCDDGAPFRVLLMRRHERSGFMGGAWVFPGGKLEREDCLGEMRALAPSSRALEERLEPTPEATLESDVAFGLCVAACRELFEEAGILLARPIDARGRTPRADDASWRGRVRDDANEFREFLIAEGVVLDFSSLSYWSHWVTPSFESRRYDARFFLAELPCGETPTIDVREATEMRWLSPQEALSEHAAEKLELPPPTQKLLDELATFSSFDALRTAARTRVVRAILPKATRVEGRVAVWMPWDPGYDDVRGDAFPDGFLRPEPLPGPSCVFTRSLGA